MDVEKYVEQMHDRTFNCCQCVLCALANQVDLDEQTLFRIGEGFGGGLGTLNGVCGALSGAVILAGLKNSDGNMEAPKSKPSTMAMVRKMQDSFREEVGAIICREIKGVDTGKVLCSCPDCVRIAARIAEEVLTGAEGKKHE